MNTMRAAWETGSAPAIARGCRLRALPADGRYSLLEVKGEEGEVNADYPYLCVFYRGRAWVED